MLQSDTLLRLPMPPRLTKPTSSGSARVAFTGTGESCCWLATPAGVEKLGVERLVDPKVATSWSLCHWPPECLKTFSCVCGGSSCVPTGHLTWQLGNGDGCWWISSSKPVHSYHNSRLAKKHCWTHCQESWENWQWILYLDSSKICIKIQRLGMHRVGLTLYVSTRNDAVVPVIFPSDPSKESFL